MPAQIELKIRNGRIEIEVDGVEDATCEQVTEALVRELGEVDNVQYKPEYYVELDHMEQHIYEEDEE